MSVRGSSHKEQGQVQTPPVGGAKSALQGWLGGWTEMWLLLKSSFMRGRNMLGQAAAVDSAGRGDPVLDHFLPFSP